MNTATSIAWYGPTNDCWNWILSHFQDVLVLRSQDMDRWLASHDSPSKLGDSKGNATLILVSEFRSETQVLEFAQRLEQTNTPKSDEGPNWCLVLGADWAGHRRTLPLPEAWHVFYWYELYDRLMPWLLGNLSKDNLTRTELTSAAVASPGNRSISPRVQRWIDLALKTTHPIEGVQDQENQKVGIALVVAETADTRELWTDVLARRNFRCVCASPLQLDLWIEPDIILVDIDPMPLAGRLGGGKRGPSDGCNDGSELEETIRRLKSQFPEAVQIVADAFPLWQRWYPLQECGTDILIAKPGFLDGVLDVLKLR
jgi:hypothetical protein